MKTANDEKTETAMEMFRPFDRGIHLKRKFSRGFRGDLIKVILFFCYFLGVTLGVVFFIATLPVSFIWGLITNKFPRWANMMIKFFVNKLPPET